MGLASGASTTLIAKNTEVVGDIHFSGTLHIEGTLKGNVYVKDGADAHLDIAENGRVEGQITVSTVRINGRVIGDIYTTKHIELAAKAEVDGNVHYKLIEMVKGAQVNGKLVYGADEVKASQPAAAPAAKASTAAPEKAQASTETA